jgi:hypothetical protein
MYFMNIALDCSLREELGVGVLCISAPYPRRDTAWDGFGQHWRPVRAHLQGQISMDDRIGSLTDLAVSR